jgi:hypothetical protein
MVGNQNSGRKPDPMTGLTRHKKITFYVKENKDFSGWKLDPTFVWFKRHHGSKWQEKLRQYMYNDVKAWKLYDFWRCECPNTGVLGNYVHRQTPQCPRCDTWKNEAMRRMHER